MACWGSRLLIGINIKRLGESAMFCLENGNLNRRAETQNAIFEVKMDPGPLAWAADPTGEMRETLYSCIMCLML